MICASTRCAFATTWLLVVPLQTAAAQDTAAQGDEKATAALPAVQVNASRLAIEPFDLPASLSVQKVQPASAGQAGVNFSEAVVGIPGILARDRQNYAQDEQISVRGFGSRTTFGVRGVKLFVDGIPATLPDGQGQVSAFNLDSANRVEVLRGPFSVLYGNAAGGVVQLWTADGTPTPQTTIGFYGGSDDTFKLSANTLGTEGNVQYNLAASTFLTGGYRDHSRVRRESDNAKFTVDLGQQRKLTVVLNRLFQPNARDPLGLTREQVNENPRQATAVAGTYNTRKSAHQTQMGAVYEQALSPNDDARVLAYYGKRSIVQFLSIPPGAQRNPLQGGGVVSPWTNYGGLDARWTHRGTLAGRGYEWVLGASGDYQRQRRTGYENFSGATLGTRGALRRDENDNVNNVAQYAQWYWHFANRFSLLLGLRNDVVRFSEHDFYITGRNPDDSGSVRYRATTPVAGLDFRAADNLRLYASFGRGFETPSYSELGYRSDGQAGLAFNLQPSRSRHYELGAKWKLTPALELDTAAFRADTDNELAVATNQNGRATYRNVGHTRRQGVELSLTGELAPGWHLAAGVTHLTARFESGFLACTDTPCAMPDTPVRAGSRLPGVPDNYGSLRLEHGGELGWREGATLTGVGAVSVNDTDTAQAAGYGLVEVDTSYTFALGQTTRLRLSARIDNLADRRFIGSVIVNDGNARYYEPGPGRTWLLGAQLRF